MILKIENDKKVGNGPIRVLYPGLAIENSKDTGLGSIGRVDHAAMKNPCPNRWKGYKYLSGRNIKTLTLKLFFRIWMRPIALITGDCWPRLPSRRYYSFQARHGSMIQNYQQAKALICRLSRK